MQPVIGIVGAMQEEVERFKEVINRSEETAVASISFTRGMMFDRQVVLCRSGVGKVNAAMTTQILIDRFGIDYLIFTGVAGAVDPSLNIGDMVISTECQQHDIDATALGFQRGEIPFAKNSLFRADPFLIELAESYQPKDKNVRLVRGKVLSGDQFVADREYVSYLYQHFGGSCVEMEGAAVAQVCHLNDIPFLIIRSISDKADGSAKVNFETFTRMAAQHSYELVCHLLQHWPDRRRSV
jgi:adenosylhomocysteine nucleosidase